MNIGCYTHSPTEDSDDEVKCEFYDKLESVYDKLQRNYIEITLGDANAKVGREEVYRPTIGKESLQ